MKGYLQLFQSAARGLRSSTSSGGRSGCRTSLGGTVWRGICSKAHMTTNSVISQSRSVLPPGDDLEQFGAEADATHNVPLPMQRRCDPSVCFRNKEHCMYSGYQYSNLTIIEENNTTNCSARIC